MPVFSTKGYGGAGMRDIASAAKLTEPALYRHFAGKQQLYRAALRYTSEHLTAGLCSAWSAISPTRDWAVLGDHVQAQMKNTPGLASMTQQLLSHSDAEITAPMFLEWANCCQAINMDNVPLNNTVLISLLSQAASFELASELLILAWGQRQFMDEVEPAQRELLRRLLRDWLIR